MKILSKQKSKIDIFRVNLLIHKGEELKFHIRLIKWLLSSGRYIVIVVEVVVIAAFVYRYKLDSELADLQEKIKEQIPYIQSLRNDEIAIRQTQFQLESIHQVKLQDPNFAGIITKIAQSTPKSIKLTNITMDRSRSFPKTNLSITGKTPSNLEVSAFIKTLQKSPTFTDISLTNISFDEETTFTITGNISDQGGKSS